MPAPPPEIKLRRLPAMAYDYRILADENLLLITGSGEVSSKDIHRVVTAFQKDPDWNPTMNMLVDWRGVTELLIDLDEIRTLATEALDEERMQLGKPLGPRAAVVIQNPDHEMIPKVYAGYLRKSGLETLVTYKLQEALDWVGVDPATIAHAA